MKVETRNLSDTKGNSSWWALYIRLSREDGDKIESLSVSHQKLKLIEYVRELDETGCYELYIDDGYTGTNFKRPDFQRMLQDIEEKKVIGVIVKDLSRLGRNSQGTTFYVQDYFPSHKVRFIAIDDRVDKDYCDFDLSDDMMIDVKNMFNGFYPKDVSKKVRSTIRTKQKAGKFIGAFACYGYRKSPDDHNMLLVDEPAAEIVKRIFSMYLSGYGQNTIAKELNKAGVPCPTEYKRLNGQNYQNARRLGNTTYWTYASIRNILRNRTYTGDMVQNKTTHPVCKKQAILLPEEKWIIVPDTHEAIIDKKTFENVQALLGKKTRPMKLAQNTHLFAGLIKCGDCGRAMCRLIRKNEPVFNCGSYNRYGTSHCSAHFIRFEVLEKAVLNDLNKILANVKNLQEMILEEEKRYASTTTRKQGDIEGYQQEIEKLEEKKAKLYEHYSDGLISKDDFGNYRARYEERIEALKKSISLLNSSEGDAVESERKDWIKRLLEVGHVEKLDRLLVVEMIEQIYIYDNHTIKIIYNFSDELKDLLEAS